MIWQPNTRDIKIRYIPPSEDQVFTAPPVALHEQSVFTDFYHSDDEYGLPKRSKKDEADDNRRNVRRSPNLAAAIATKMANFFRARESSLP